jgi:hypothetical protein
MEFTPRRHIKPGVMFDSETEAYPSGAPFQTSVKHSSLFCCSIKDEEKRSITIDIKR